MRLLQKLWGTTSTHQISTIPLTDPIFDRARRVVRPELHGNLWLAGSAATRYPQNGDVDVWVAQVDRRLDPWEVIIGQKKRPEPDNEQDYPGALKVYDEDGLHIMAFHETMQDILDHFDISCHSAAVHLDTGSTIFGIGYADKVTIHHVAQPHLTLERYLRFAKRYRDWTGLNDKAVVECAKSCWNLMDSQDLQNKLNYSWIDKGL